MILTLHKIDGTVEVFKKAHVDDVHGAGLTIEMDDDTQRYGTRRLTLCLALAND